MFFELPPNVCDDSASTSTSMTFPRPCTPPFNHVAIESNLFKIQVICTISIEAISNYLPTESAEIT